jgi:hypothetical protein
MMILSTNASSHGQRYGGAVDVERAAELYSQGWSLRKIGAELGVKWTSVSQQLLRAGVIMRPRAAPVHPASTQRILELRDKGLTWAEVAEQVGMTVSGAWSRYRRAQPPKSPPLGRWHQVFDDALHQNLAIGVRAAVADHLGRAPTRAELTAARRAAHSFAALGRARVLYVPGSDADGSAGDRSFLVLARPNVIMSDTRLRGLAVAGNDAAGRRNSHNHAQTARNLKRTLTNAAAGARLIQAEALDHKSALDVAASLSDALDELHRLERRLDRRIRRDQIEIRLGCPAAQGRPNTALPLDAVALVRVRLDEVHHVLVGPGTRRARLLLPRRCRDQNGNDK